MSSFSPRRLSKRLVGPRSSLLLIAATLFIIAYSSFSSDTKTRQPRSLDRQQPLGGAQNPDWSIEPPETDQLKPHSFWPISKEKIPTAPRKVLYFSRHKGTIEDFRAVAVKLGVLVDVLAPTHDYGGPPECLLTKDCSYLIKHICKTYDAIVIADTVPDGRPFWQERCSRHARIVIQVTNRFDFSVPSSTFKTYYGEVHSVGTNSSSNVRIAVSSPFQYLFMCLRTVRPAPLWVRPIGFVPPMNPPIHWSYLRGHENRIAVVAHKDDGQATIVNELKSVGVEFKLAGGENRPEVSRGGWQAVEGPQGRLYRFIHLRFQSACITLVPSRPQLSSIDLYQSLKSGVVHLIPTLSFYTKLLEAPSSPFKKPDSYSDIVNLDGGLTIWSEYYRPEFDDLFVRFGSWEELAHLVRGPEGEAMLRDVRHNVKLAMEAFEDETLRAWKEALGFWGAASKAPDAGLPTCSRSVFKR
ncbi:hypothetical protein BDK51DRAFT_34447 [Blyttiomyces helicus]|uniref:Rhodanese domain-containing protein n=1 Tax=Blyttiomyces helicus TaxID=388810 RepID=A0A4P9W7B0_9FUNG|nr:hypothetical protein BDK51DRAFT_34447 [Blyttiomyces helicus]|eukprot:RKO87952.1 hypothetical protein BDK51DRAFT_34447 [Blyttiomyces helicus]